MIAVIPACFGPHEVLADTEQATTFTLQSVDAAQAGGMERCLVCTDSPSLAAASIEAGAESLLLECASDNELLPRGSRQALEAVGRQDLTRVLLDPRNPMITGEHVATALKLLQSSGAPYVLSVHTPKDHPCQGKIFFTFREIGTVMECGLGASPLPSLGSTQDLLESVSKALPGALLRGVGLCVGSYDAALLVEREGDGAYLALIGGNASPGNALCEIYVPAQAQRLACRLVATNPPLFRLEKRLGNGFGAMTWILVEALDQPGAYDLRGNFEPLGAPWETNPKDLRPRNTVSHQVVAGRQDFPEVFAPEGSLVMLAPDAAFPAPKTLDAAGFEILVLDNKDALRVTSRLDMLKFETAIEMKHHAC
jgi:CMP-N-acetylneuraminic acid synthetase